MAKQKAKQEIEARQENLVFTEEEFSMYNHYNELITKSLMAREHAQMTAGGAFAVIADKSLYRVSGYTSIMDYARVEHGYDGSKSQLSDMINTFKAFGDFKTCQVKPEWALYSFSQLKLMRKLSIEDLKKVTPAITTRELAEIIKGYKAINKKEEEPEKTEESAQPEESAKTEESAQPKDTVKVENSGNVEPYVEVTYSITDFAEMDAESIKAFILDAFKAGNNVRMNYKY